MAGYSENDVGDVPGILADAMRASETDDVERWLIAHNPMLATGDFGMMPVGLRGEAGPSGGGSAAGGARKALRLPARLPGVLLPATADLAAVARRAPLAGQLAGLAGLTGRGRPVSKGYELSGEDAAAVARQLDVTASAFRLLWEYALAASWVVVTDGGDGRMLAVPGEMAADWAAGSDAGVLRAWGALLTAVLARTLDVAASQSPAAPPALSFQGQGSLAALRLFLARGDGGLPAHQVRALVLDRAVGDLAMGRVRKQLDARARAHPDPVRVLLDQLAELGAVEPSPAGEDRIRLTTLAQRALRADLAAIGVEVPATGDQPGCMTAGGLVALHGGVPAAEFARLAGQWVAARGAGRAAAELLELAATADAAGRLVAIGVVRGLGEAAAPAWRDGLRRPELRPYSRIELSRLASVMAESTLPLVLEPNPDDLTWLATDLLALACGEEDPDPELIAAQFREAVPAGDEAWIFSLMSMGSHPDVVQVLTILGRYHPDRRIARGARKAAHRAVARRASGARGASARKPAPRAARE
ncbi:MAG TPA: hypothetical protein VMG38_22375 [Trebonia sp.]|nr:hypothetical protein [Trebonia sp.]